MALVGTCAAAVTAACALTACTSSATSGPTAGPPSAPSLGSTASSTGESIGSVAPTTSAATSRSSATAPPTDPSTPRSHDSSQAEPQSKYENDPGVKLLRTWAAQVAHTITHGNYDDAKLRKLMTPQMAADMKRLAGPEAGRIYPGPLPFTPISVVAPSSTVRDIRLCFVSNGYSLNPKTHQPYPKHSVQGVAARVQKVGSSWKLAQFYTENFSCQGVSIEEPSF